MSGSKKCRGKNLGCEETGLTGGLTDAWGEDEKSASALLAKEDGRRMGKEAMGEHFRLPGMLTTKLVMYPQGEMIVDHRNVIPALRLTRRL
jgi:hypothetical protein